MSGNEINGYFVIVVGVGGWLILNAEHTVGIKNDLFFFIFVGVCVSTNFAELAR